MQANNMLPSAGRELPNDPEGEKNLLACILISPAKVLGMIHAKTGGCPDLFYTPRHRKLYECMQSMHRAGESVNAKTVAQRLEAEGSLGEIGGPGFLRQLLDRMMPGAAPGSVAGLERGGR